MSLLRDLQRLRTALSESENFRDWVGVTTAADALDYIFYFTADRTLIDKESGYNCVIISHGGTFQRDRRSYGGSWDTQPQIKAEFITLIDHDDDDSDTFETLLTDMSSILDDLESQTVCEIDAYSPSDEDTPVRAPHSANNVDWASITILFECGAWQGSGT